MPFSHLTRRDWVAYGLALAYTIICFTLMVLKHNAFNTRVFDFARFSQAIWNTLDGQILYTSLSERSILGDHFSPIMALVAPLLWIWPNERILFLVQAVNVAAAGVILYYLMRDKHPTIAPWFALAFFLNPAIHEVTLFEFRRVVFGMPWLALGLYGLLTGKRRVMLVGLLIALLSKENLAIDMAMIGLFLLIFERNWRWGSALILVGAAWSYVIGDIVIPAFNTQTELYPQLYYYSHLGSSYGDIFKVGIQEPWRLLQIMFGRPQLLALGRILLPLGFLVLLDIRVALISAPYIALMFLSQDVDMFQLDKWYTATIMPVFFAAVASGWHHLPHKWETPALVWLLSTTVIAYAWYGYGPLGGRFDPALYQPTPRDQLSQGIIDRIPEDASVIAHPRYIPHLTHINELYHYLEKDNIEADYILMDRKVQFSPFGEFEINEEVMNLVIDPDYTIVEEVDGIYLLSYGKEPLPAYPVDKTAEDKIHLERFELAVPDERGFFTNITDSLPTLEVGDTIRVTMYWEAFGGNNAERTVSVRLAAADGFLLAQQDQLPAAGFKPTSWWQTGWRVRDIYYLTIPEGTAAQSGSLDLVLYDSYTQEPVHFAEEEDILHLMPVQFVDQRP